ncbi:hypothetical protein JOB18_030819 [Solea senegalensis]|uniref:Uncharacterized protein n=1 Tax=Solea senegalensis TaxID=28829 RepID=A0AAV6RNH5_SOLSE|nr:hypothetical protein JOB18_030819 [Solea senegalensis]
MSRLVSALLLDSVPLADGRQIYFLAGAIVFQSEALLIANSSEFSHESVVCVTGEQLIESEEIHSPAAAPLTDERTTVSGRNRARGRSSLGPQTGTSSESLLLSRANISLRIPKRDDLCLPQPVRRQTSGSSPLSFSLRFLAASARFLCVYHCNQQARPLQSAKRPETKQQRAAAAERKSEGEVFSSFSADTEKKRVCLASRI